MFDKVTIVGAGHVGSNVAYLLVLKNLCRKLTLIDIQKDLVQAVVLDLQDSRFSFGSDVIIEASSRLEDVASSDIVVIAAGRPRSPGMSREDLIKINSSIVKDVSRAVRRKAKGAIVVVITNPLDIMTYVALKTTGFTRDKVIGMGSSLDSARFANLLSKKVGASVEDINPLVFGAHGKNMLVSAKASLRGFSLKQVLKAREFRLLKKQTIDRGARIVGLLKEGSARFGPAASCLDILEAIALDKKKLALAAVYVKGEYGLTGVCLGLPVIIGAPGIEKILVLSIPRSERKVLVQAARAIKKQISLL